MEPAQKIPVEKEPSSNKVDVHAENITSEQHANKPSEKKIAAEEHHSPTKEASAKKVEVTQVHDTKKLSEKVIIPEEVVEAKASTTNPSTKKLTPEPEHTKQPSVKFIEPDHHEPGKMPS